MALNFGIDVKMNFHIDNRLKTQAENEECNAKDKSRTANNVYEIIARSSQRFIYYMLAVRNLASSKLGNKLPNFQLYSKKNWRSNFYNGKFNFLKVCACAVAVFL